MRGGPPGPLARAASRWLGRLARRVGVEAGEAAVAVRRDRVDGLAWVSRRPAAPPPAGAPAVVLVHGLGTSGTSLLRVLEHLAPTFDVWAPDLPGFGASDRPPRALDLAELADALVAWMDAVGLERAATLGHSMGCQVIGHVVTRHPGRLTRAVLVAPTLDPAARSVHRQARRLAADALREPRSTLPWAFADYVRCGPLRMLRTLRDALAVPVEERLPRIAVPVLLVRGERDPVAPQPWIDRAAALLPDARAVVVPGAAHGVNYSHPRELADVVAPFLHGAS